MSTPDDLSEQSIIKTLIDCENIYDLKNHLATNSLESLLAEFVEFSYADKSASLIKQQAYVMRLLRDLYNWQISQLASLTAISDHVEAYQDIVACGYDVSSHPDQYYIIIAMYNLRY